MFSGTVVYSIDSKGRIVLPAKFREELGDSFYITDGFNTCLQIMSKSEFNHLIEQIKLLPADKALSLQYVLISPAVEISCNAQGRITIPSKLKDDAHLDKDVVIVGMDTRIELWDKNLFDAFIKDQKEKSLREALELLRL